MKLRCCVLKLYYLYPQLSIRRLQRLRAVGYVDFVEYLGSLLDALSAAVGFVQVTGKGVCVKISAREGDLIRVSVEEEGCAEESILTNGGEGGSARKELSDIAYCLGMASFRG